MRDDPSFKCADIKIPNLDEALLALLYAATEEQCERIPPGLFLKIHRKGTFKIDRLVIQEKLFLLTIAFRKNFAVVIEDEKSSLTVEQFLNALRVEYGKSKATDVAEDLQARGAFVFGPKEVIDAYSYMRLASCTDIYRVVSKVRKLAKGYSETRQQNWLAAMRFMVGLFSAYEIHKKKIWSVFNINATEFCALLFFYHKERPGADFLNSDFIVTTKKGTLASAVARSLKKGNLMKRGVNNKLMFSITAEGKRKVDEIFEKIINH